MATYLVYGEGIGEDGNSMDVNSILKSDKLSEEVFKKFMEDIQKDLKLKSLIIKNIMKL